MNRAPSQRFHHPHQSDAHPYYHQDAYYNSQGHAYHHYKPRHYRAPPPHRLLSPPPSRERRHPATLLPPIETSFAHHTSTLTEAPPPLPRPRAPSTSYRQRPRPAPYAEYSTRRTQSPPHRHHDASRSSRYPPDLSPPSAYYDRQCDDILFPLTPQSAKFESPAMVALDPREHALERLPHLRISDRGYELPPKSSSEDDYPSTYRGMSPAERRFLQTVVPEHRRPVTAYPVTGGYSWPPTTEVPTAEAQQQPQVGDEKPDPNAMALDPALSSVRSSTDGTAAGNGAQAPPELRLIPETLGSAAAESPAADVEIKEAIAQVPSVQQSLAPPEQKKETPFSRSPELRISHKLAERKRRKEMRDLFDELRDALPQDRGMKASKWEILSKAIDYIQALKGQVNDSHRQMEILARDLAIARGESPNTHWASSYHNFASTIPAYVPPATTAAPAPAPAPAPAATAAPAPAAPAQAQVPAAQPQPQVAAAPAAPAPTQAQPAQPTQPAQAAAQPATTAVAQPAQPVITAQTSQPQPAAQPAVAQPQQQPQVAQAQPAQTQPAPTAQPAQSAQPSATPTPATETPTA